MHFNVNRSIRLQQYLPFTVLKLCAYFIVNVKESFVATVPTVYGIETMLHCVLIADD